MSLPLRADAPSKAAEPSMEEILASIRKIIADDDAGAPKTPAEPEPEPAAAADEGQGQDDIDAILAGLDASPEPEKAPEPEPARVSDILELTEEMAAPDQEFGDVDLDFVDPSQSEPEPEPEPAPPPRATFVPPPRAAAPPPPAESLLSDHTNASIAAAFGSLSHTILSQNARTLDDLVQDMLRPMLKNWLDDNLPGLVERLVRAEIERVSRGGR